MAAAVSGPLDPNLPRLVDALLSETVGPRGETRGQYFDRVIWPQLSTTIEFYDRRAPYYEFTNFFAGCPFQDENGSLWKTSEHYFQAHKFYPDRGDLVERVRRAKTARRAFELPRERSRERERTRTRTRAVVRAARCCCVQPTALPTLEKTCS